MGIALSVLREPMLLFLVVCGALYLILGARQGALLLLGFVFLVIGITFVQERKTERAVEALRDLTSPRALVVRGGQRLRVAGREVVSGDIVVLSEGDRVPADGLVLAAVSLTTDESLLTGESAPVRKMAAEGEASIGLPGGDDTPFVFSGSLVVGGRAYARIVRTGAEWESARSALRSAPSRASRRRWSARCRGWCGGSSARGWCCACSLWWSTGPRTTPGSARFLPASRWPWPCCPRSSPSS